MSRMFFGENPVLEGEADRLIRESMRGQMSHSSKSDILTPWKLQDRKGREVMVSSGTPDPSIRRGLFHRVANPVSLHLNSRDGVAAAPHRERRMSDSGRS